VAKIRQELTGYLASDNPKSDNMIITGEFSSDNQRSYKDKYGNVSQMNITNIGSDNTRELLTNNAENINKDEIVSNQKLIEQFEIGQLVKLQLSHFDGASSRRSI
jgi:hypothetical protein